LEKIEALTEEYYLKIGKIYAEEEYPKEALNWLDKITGKTGQAVDFLGTKGEVLFELDHDTKAMEYYTQALNI